MELNPLKPRCSVAGSWCSCIFAGLCFEYIVDVPRELVSSSACLVAVLRFASLGLFERLSWYGFWLGQRQNYSGWACGRSTGLLGFRNMIGYSRGQHWTNDVALVGRQPFDPKAIQNSWQLAQLRYPVLSSSFSNLIIVMCSSKVSSNALANWFPTHPYCFGQSW